jgi:hypothetical protein
MIAGMCSEGVRKEAHTRILCSLQSKESGGHHSTERTVSPPLPPASGISKCWSLGKVPTCNTNQCGQCHHRLLRDAIVGSQVFRCSWRELKRSPRRLSQRRSSWPAQIVAIMGGGLRGRTGRAVRDSGGFRLAGNRCGCRKGRILTLGARRKVGLKV